MIYQFHVIYPVPSRMYASVQVETNLGERAARAMALARIEEATGYDCTEITPVAVTNNPNYYATTW